jgi:hypothetical protein
MLHVILLSVILINVALESIDMLDVVLQGVVVLNVTLQFHSIIFNAILKCHFNGAASENDVMPSVILQSVAMLVSLSRVSFC